MVIETKVFVVSLKFFCEQLHQGFDFGGFDYGDFRTSKGRYQDNLLR